MLSKALSLVLFAVVSLGCLVALPHVHITTAITDFLPASADHEAARLAKEIVGGELSSTVVLDVSGAPADDLERDARALMTKIALLPGTLRVRSGMDEDAGRALLDLLAKRSPTALLRPAAFDDVPARLARTKERLGSSAEPFVREIVRREPLGGTLDMLDELTAVQGLTSENGILVDADRKHAFLITVGKASAFETADQRAWLDQIRQAFQDVQKNETLEMSGVPRISIAAEAQIRGDINRIGTISTVGILLLFGLLFRSPRMLALGLVPLWFGSALAILATYAVFGEIHGLTLAFGTSLLGVGIDYAEHYFAHFALTPHEGARKVMHTVWPGLWLGAVTTILGFAGLGVTGFPGIRQIAFFSTVAIVGALAGTRLLLPAWMPVTYKSPPVLLRVSEAARKIIANTPRRGLVLVPIVITIALVPGLLRTRWIDDPSVFVAIDPAILAEDAKVQARVNPLDPGRFVVVVNPDEEQALEALDRTTAALDEARHDGVLDGFLPLGSLIHSAAQQRASFDRARAPGERARLDADLAAAGFVPRLFAPFFEALQGAPSILTLDDLRASPLGSLIGSFAPRLADGQAFVIPLRGVHDMDALRTRLPGLDAHVIDEGALLEETYRGVRKQTIRMLLLGLVLVLGVLVLRYRSGRVVLAAFLPAVLGALGALSVDGLLGLPLNVLHLVAVLLVLSMGTDFGIFVVEARGTASEEAHSLVSIATATTTTLLSFGLLALSPSPALRTLGTTITVGLLLAAVLCPLGLIVLGTSSRRDGVDKST